MARSLNRVTLLGNLGQDADVKSTGSGVSVASMSIATERRWKDKNSDEWKSETDWHRVTLWRCEGVAKFLTKGKSVLVEGRLQTRSYDKDGEKRYVTEVIADNVILLGDGRGGDASTPGRPPAEASDDDVPF